MVILYKIIFFVLMLGLGRVVHLNKKALFRNQLRTTRPYFVSPIPCQPSSVPSDKRSRRPSRGFVNALEPPSSCIVAIRWTERKYLDPVQHNTRQTYPKDPKVVIFALSSHQQLGFQIINMDPRYTGEILKHLEKQNELLTEAKISMSEELHQLKVEEEMLMRKFYEIMSAHGKVKKNGDGGKVSDDGEIGSSTASAVANTTNDEECR